MAQSHGLVTPTLNRCDRSRIDVLSHAAKETDVLYGTVFIEEDFGDLQSVEAPEFNAGEIRGHVDDPLRLIGVAADTTGKWGIDLTRRWRARGDWRLV